MILWEAAIVGSNRRVRPEPEHSSWCCQGCISSFTPGSRLLSQTLHKSSLQDPQLVKTDDGSVVAKPVLRVRDGGF